MTVYMLGRGAEKNLMSFLSAEDDGGSEGRIRLNQKACGEGSDYLIENTMMIIGVGLG